MERGIDSSKTAARCARCGMTCRDHEWHVWRDNDGRHEGGVCTDCRTATELTGSYDPKHEGERNGTLHQRGT